MSAADAQWIVVGFLNLACQIAVVMLLAGGAEVLVKRCGAGPKAFVWTMALVSLVVVIGARLASSPITRAPVRFAEARQESESEWSHFDSSEEVAETPRGIFAEHRMSELPESEGQEGAFPNAMETVSPERARESHGNDLVREESETEAPLPWDAERQPFSPASRRRSADTSVNVRVNEKTNSWQVAGWGVAALCLVSALLLLRVLIGTLSLKNLILRWRARDASATLNGTLDELRRVLGMKRRVRLLISPKNGAPIAFGTFRPTIILPSGLMERIGTEGVRQMLAHELAHVRRYDSLVILLQRVCTALCFWHPLVHVANRRLRILIEDACDDCVLRITREPRAYADCLTKLAEQKLCRLPGIAGWIGAKRKRLKLERRIQKILDRARPLGPLSAVAAMAMVLVAVIASLISGRIPLFGIAAEEGISAGKMQAAEAEVLTPLEGETPLKHAQRLLMEGYASPAIEVLRKAIGESDGPGTATGLRYELARAYHLLVNTQNLERTLSEIWATVPADVGEIDQFADFCIDTGQERLARDAVERLQELEPEKRVYHASKLYGAFPKPQELWFPFKPKAMEKTDPMIAGRKAMMYREQLTPALARVVQAADLDADGSPEVVLSTRSRMKPAWIRVFSLYGELLWKDEGEEQDRHDDILVFDLDGDGKLEIIAAGLSMTAYDCKGKILWQRPSPRADSGHALRRTRIVRSPEHRYRIISGVDNCIVCLSPDGKVEWERIGVVGDSFVTADFNRDGWDEILTIKLPGRELAAFDQGGEEILSGPTDLDSWRVQLAAEDLDGDGMPEIIGWRGGEKLLVCGMDGKALWKTPSRDAPLYSVGDLDGDGKKEIACVTPSEEVRVLNHDGSTRLELAIPTIALQLADIDGDGKDEILAESRSMPGRYLFCIGGDGQLRWRFPLTRSYTYGFYAMRATKAGRKGIIAAASGALITLSAEGNVLSITPMASFPDVLAADLDGDGIKEVLADAPLLRAYDLRRNEALWGGMAVQDIVVDSGAAAIDVDGDGAEEIVFTCRGYVSIVNEKGQLVHAKYVGESGEPVLGRIDVEGDGKDEILLCDNRRFLILNGQGEVIGAASHRGFEVDPLSEVPPQKVILAADIDSVAGDEILTCVDGEGVTGYSPQGKAIMRFRRPSWLPVHPGYDGLSHFWRPQIFAPVDLDGDGKRELAARIDRLYVWDLRGNLLPIAFNDYPSRQQIAFARLTNGLQGLARYVSELGALGSIREYLEKAQKKPFMQFYTCVLPIPLGRETALAVCSENAMRLMRPDGTILWRFPAEQGPRDRLRGPKNLEGPLGEYEDVIRTDLRCVAFADFDGDGRKEVVMETKAHELPNGRAVGPWAQVKRLEAFSAKGERLWQGVEAEDFTHFSQYVYGDFDGDGFMEITLEHKPGIAVLDLTPR